MVVMMISVEKLQLYSPGTEPRKNEDLGLTNLIFQFVNLLLIGFSAGIFFLFFFYLLTLIFSRTFLKITLVREPPG